MKKISLLLIFICCMFITGCNSKEEKEVKTLDDFEVACNSNGFTTEDNIGNYENVSYVTGAKIATLDDITIEMVSYDTVENAKNAQNSHIDVFKTMKGSGAVINNTKGKNYYSYDMISNGYYLISTRVDNTLVFSKTPVTNKEKIDAILNNMGY